MALTDSRKLINKLILTYLKLLKIIKEINKNNNIYFYIENDKIVGSITLLIEQKLIHNGKCVGHIEDFVVSENYRKKGIGSNLINYAINIAERSNCYKCILDCNENLESYYKKKGFVKKVFTWVIILNDKKYKKKLNMI